MALGFINVLVKKQNHCILFSFCFVAAVVVVVVVFNENTFNLDWPNKH